MQMTFTAEQRIEVASELVKSAATCEELDTPALLEKATRLREVAAQMVAPFVGTDVSVIPHVNRGTGESRDTEPGLQPWDAVFAGVDTSARRGGFKVTVDGFGERTLRTGPLAIVGSKQDRLQIGSW